MKHYFFTMPAVILLATFLLKCGDSPTPKPPPPRGSWLVLLCKAADAPNEPQPKSFYEGVFSKGQRDLLFDYFDNASNHTVDVSATEVYGWFPMSVKTADIAPNVRNNGTAVTRTQTARDCKASALGGIMATGVNVDPANYAGVITVINVPVDSGDTGEKAVVLGGHAEVEIGFVAHEMLHVLGLSDHSWRASADTSPDHVWNHGGDTQYNDCYDMMSFRTCCYTFQSTSGPQGPELQGAYRQKLGWLDTNRIRVIGVYPPGTSTFTLAPVSDPTKPGVLLAKIEVENQGYYVVEFRKKSGFDRGIPADAVLVREQRVLGPGNYGITYLVHRQGGKIAWQKGEMFTDTANFLSITVDDILPDGAQITVNTKYSTTSPKAGDWCGDKYRGEVFTCPGSTQCKPRVGGGIQTIDYFCL